MNMVENYYNAEKETDRTIILINCQNSNLDKVVNSHLPKCRASANKTKEAVDSSTIDQPFCFVYLNAHLLSAPQQHYVASCAIEVSALFILVVEVFNPEDLTIRVEDRSTHSLHVLQVPMHSIEKNIISIFSRERNGMQFPIFLSCLYRAKFIAFTEY
jgi:hypothetical protein